MYLNKRGYAMVLQPRQGKSGGKYIGEHRLIVERAIGHRLPPQAEVHHFNEIKHENRNDNLVACENHSYHELLHHRAAIIQLGGHPDVHNWCTSCHRLKEVADFYSSRSRISGYENKCKQCDKARKPIRPKIERRKTHCSMGHQFNYRNKHGLPVCNVCHAARERARRAKARPA